MGERRTGTLTARKSSDWLSKCPPLALGVINFNGKIKVPEVTRQGGAATTFIPRLFPRALFRNSFQ